MATSESSHPHVVRTPAAIGRAVRRARLQKGWTQQELAERSTVNRHTVMAVEDGHETKAIRAILETLSALDLELVISERGGP